PGLVTLGHTLPSSAWMPGGTEWSLFIIGRSKFKLRPTGRTRHPSAGRVSHGGSCSPNQFRTDSAPQATERKSVDHCDYGNARDVHGVTRHRDCERLIASYRRRSCYQL